MKKLGGKNRWKIWWKNLVDKLNEKLGGSIRWIIQVENWVDNFCGKIVLKIRWKNLGGIIR